MPATQMTQLLQLSEPSQVQLPAQPVEGGDPLLTAQVLRDKAATLQIPPGTNGNRLKTQQSPSLSNSIVFAGAKFVTLGGLAQS